jgi:surface protein
MDAWMMFGLFAILACGDKASEETTETETADTGSTETTDTGVDTGTESTDSADTGDTEVAPEPASIEVTPTAVNLSFIGDNVDLDALVYDENGTVMEDVPLTWASNDDSIVTISETGVVTAVGLGTTEITCTVNDIVVEIAVEVIQALFYTPDGITIMCPTANIGDTGEVNGITYTKRARSNQTVNGVLVTGLRSLIVTSEWDLVETTCTTDITDMSDLVTANSVDGYNGDLRAWDTSNVTTMNQMFKGKSFNGDISTWDVSNVTDMAEMFRWNEAFNGDIGGWDVSNVTTMTRMFNGAESFNGDIGGWDVSSVESISHLFLYASAFNQDIGGWDVSNTSQMLSAFNGATSFNQDIGGWDVSSVVSMQSMFAGATSFNQDISEWDVSGVASMPYMFQNASNFNQDLSGWCVDDITTAPTGFDDDATNWVLSRPVWGTCP